MVDPTSCVVPEGCSLTQAEKDCIGFPNDCFLSDYNDMGTYDNNSWMGWYYIEQKKQWMYDLATSTGNNKIVGGETCNSDGYNDAACVNAQTEMNRLNFTEINEDYADININKWKAANLVASGNDPAETCFTRINRKLGHRLRLTDATFPTTVTPGGTLTFSANLVNDGWSAPIKPRPAFLVLSGTGGTYPVALNVDPRGWLPGAHTIPAQTVTVPTMPAGSYRLALWLPDQASGLRSNPAYSVRFANTGTWDAITGVNVLAASVTVGSCTGTCPTPTPSWSSTTPTDHTSPLAWSSRPTGSDPDPSTSSDCGYHRR